LLLWTLAGLSGPGLAGCVDKAGPPGDVPDAGGTPIVPLPAVPLHTQGRFVVDANGARFKLASVNWYGAESPDLVVDGLMLQDLDAIAGSIRQLGFNSVRLPWCNELVARNPVIEPRMLTANPALMGKTALEVLDAVIAALGRAGLVVILDNHRSRGDWCCDVAHGDGLWYTAEYPQDVWLDHWRQIAMRYSSNPVVVGADLRNEIRNQLAAGVPATCTDCNAPTADCVCERGTWGDTSMPTYRDWPSAAELAGNAILQVAPNWLIVVEGPDYATWLGASYRPVRLTMTNRTVYSVHQYSMNGGFRGDCAAYQASLDSNFGNVAKSGLGPVWVGEFGINHSNTTDPWWNCFLDYLQTNDLDWAYWPLNGTQGSGYGRTAGGEEGYGVLNPAWTAPASETHLGQLQQIQAAHLTP